VGLEHNFLGGRSFDLLRHIGPRATLPPSRSNDSAEKDERKQS
jgi:hypothetical protein